MKFLSPMAKKSAKKKTVKKAAKKTVTKKAVKKIAKGANSQLVFATFGSTSILSQGMAETAELSANSAILA